MVARAVGEIDQVHHGAAQPPSLHQTSVHDRIPELKKTDVVIIEALEKEQFT